MSNTRACSCALPVTVFTIFNMLTLVMSLVLGTRGEGGNCKLRRTGVGGRSMWCWELDVVFLGWKSRDVTTGRGVGLLSMVPYHDRRVAIRERKRAVILSFPHFGCA